jgi:hypothetical protein
VVEVLVEAGVVASVVPVALPVTLVGVVTPHQVTPAVEAGAGVAEAKDEVVVAAAVVAETKTPTAGELWYGGREGYQDYSDEWVATRSWYFYKLVAPLCDCSQCDACLRGIQVYLKLHITGSPKGRCKPTHAYASVGMGREKLGQFGHTSGATKVTSIRQAQRWAEEECWSPLGIKMVYERFYSTGEPKKRGLLIEKLHEDLGWVEWFWSFDRHPNWNVLLGSSKARYRDESGKMYLVVSSSGHGWGMSSWPSVWDRVASTGRGTQDAFGVL